MEKTDKYKDVKFRHVMPIQLRFNDLDRLGHVNNAVYFSFYDLAKTHYFTDVFGTIDWEEHVTIIASLHSDFYAPIFFDEKIAVETAVVEIGNKSFKLLQRGVNTETGEVKCSCETVMVGYNLKTLQAEPIPQEWKDAFCAYEGRDLLRK